MNLKEAIEKVSGLQDGDILDTDEVEAIKVLTASFFYEAELADLSAPQRLWLEHEVAGFNATLSDIPDWVIRMVVGCQLSAVAMALIWPHWKYDRKTRQVSPCRS